MMKKLLFILCMLPGLMFAQETKKNNFKKALKRTFKFATFYGAVNGGNSISDVDVYSVTNGLETSTIKTPFDYSLAFGVRKIARLGYENRANTFYNGTEKSFSDNATIGKIKGFEFLFELDYTRQQGINFLNQQHFLRYVADQWIAKVEYLDHKYIGKYTCLLFMLKYLEYNTIEIDKIIDHKFDRKEIIDKELIKLKKHLSYSKHHNLIPLRLRYNEK